MIILGIDPGTTGAGYGVIEKAGKLRALEYGIIKTEGGQAERLNQIAEKIESLIKKYQPEAAGVETLFFSKNKKTAISVAEARGVIMQTLMKHGVKTFEFSPNNVKSVVTGYGGSSKEGMEKIVCLTLGIKEFDAADDAADALALAIRTSFEKR